MEILEWKSWNGNTEHTNRSVDIEYTLLDARKQSIQILIIQKCICRAINSFSFTVVQSNWMFSIHNNKTISKRKTDYTKSEYTRSAHQIFLSSALSALSTKRARARSHTHMTIYDATCSDPCIVLMLLPTVAARTRRRSERSTASAAISAISVWERASGDNECTPNGKQRTKNNASAKLTAKENRSSISAHVCVLSVCHYWLRTPLTCSVCCVNGRWCRHSSRKRERERETCREQ